MQLTQINTFTLFGCRFYTKFTTYSPRHGAPEYLYTEVELWIKTSADSTLGQVRPATYNVELQTSGGERWLSKWQFLVSIDLKG